MNKISGDYVIIPSANQNEEYMAKIEYWEFPQKILRTVSIYLRVFRVKILNDPWQ